MFKAAKFAMLLIFGAMAPVASVRAECKASRLGIPAQSQFDRFFSQFQAAVRTSNAERIADMAFYPITVRSRIGQFIFKNKGEFRPVVSLILHGRVRDLIGQKKLADLHCDASEVSFQGGRVGVKWTESRVGVSSISID